LSVAIDWMTHIDH